MGLDIWFAEDIRNALLAANEASAATAAVVAGVGGCPSTCPSTGSGQKSGQGASTLREALLPGQDRTQASGQAVTDWSELLAVSLGAYREGYAAALATVALAFGISPVALWPETVRVGDDQFQGDDRGAKDKTNPSAPSGL
jgi:hypothetical protein